MYIHVLRYYINSSESDAKPEKTAINNNIWYVLVRRRFPIFDLQASILMPKYQPCTWYIRNDSEQVRSPARRRGLHMYATREEPPTIMRGPNCNTTFQKLVQRHCLTGQGWIFGRPFFCGENASEARGGARATAPAGLEPPKGIYGRV